MYLHRSFRSWQPALAAGLFLTSSAWAQDPTEVTGQAQSVVVQPMQLRQVFSPDVPVPPKALAPRLSDHPSQVIPEGPYRPAPNSAPVEVQDIAAQPEGNGAFRFFQNEPVEPSGASTSSVGEPSVAAKDDVVLQTGNWYAARSLDNGSSFDYVSPYTFFPSVDNGFCCDQRVKYIASRDITVWQLQYGYSSSTERGSYVIAVANGRADIANPSASAWTTYRVDPTTFGLNTRSWFDFPDMAVSNDRLWVSANVFAGATGGSNSAVVMGFDLDDLDQNVGVQITFAVQANLLGGTYRFADGFTRDRIYFGSLNTTSSFYIYRMTDTGSWSRVTRNVGTVSTGSGSSNANRPGDGNWTNQASTRFRGAYGTATEIGFLLTSRPNGSRPQPYVRVSRFSADEARTLVGERDIWSSTTAYGYAAAGSNSLNHVAVSMAYSNTSTYVSPAYFLVDQYNDWNSIQLFTSGTGTRGPSGNRWGDYFDVHRHPEHTDTFIATNMRQDGGTSNGANEPRYLWFGREDYEPAWVDATVTSTGITSGLPVTLNIEDMDNRGSSSTPYTRRFAPSQRYELTAPSTRTSGGVQWLFERWTYQVSPGGTVFTRPIGDTTLSLNVGSVDDTLIANYKRRRTLTIRSVNPTSGVSITVSPDDFFGNGNTTTSSTRTYRDGEVVTLTAPSAIGVDPFRYWRINGIAQRTPNRTLSLTMSANVTAEVVYWDNIAGTVRTLGAGCVGGNGRIPLQTVSAGSRGPQQGSTTSYNLSGAAPNSGCVLHFGFDRNRWGSFNLPLDLSFVGMTGCSLYHDLAVSPALATGSAGTARFPIVYPVDPAAVGTNIYTTYAVVDLGAPRPTKVTHSNAIDVSIGGNR